MHVHSFLPLLGFSLVHLGTASHGAYHPHQKRDLQVSNSLPEAWSSSGSYTDSVSDRALSRDGYAADDMTEGKCIGYCDQKGYSFAGVEYGTECYCGYQVASTSSQTADSDCSFPCGGANGEACGGSDRINIFTNGVAGPVENPGIDGWTSLGCYTDSQSARILSTYEPVSDGIVFVRGCTEICQQNGFSYAGVEYGQECYCGNEILATGMPAAPESCDMPRTGDRTEKS
ncbi:hypothetical protein OHC33_002783 [Knufia fluminis]|uniref:WSC domain-containing protein n=1 Tax=Knufia fluminis TaxID=191047 RepID=A0AAN8I7P2_9EURO|nr:hypothetical protein OHC33_002783 [Knufia fluminis]